MTGAFEHFHFLRPWWLAALLPAAAVWLALWRNSDPLRAYRKLIAPHLLEHLVVREGTGGWLRPETLLLPALVLAAVAMAGPSFRLEPSPFAQQKAGLAVVIRVNPTMEATDVRPSRLARAKQKLHDLLQLMPGSPVALIAYSGSAHLVMPFTRDGGIIEQMADALSPGIMPVEGDALSKALELADDQLRRAKIGGSILVIADGISAGQLPALERYRSGAHAGVQVLGVVGGSKTAQETGLVRGVSALGAPLELVSVDGSDVQKIHGRSKKLISTVVTPGEGSRWRDEGYWLLPVILLLALPWARRGWSVAWS